MEPVEAYRLIIGLIVANDWDIFDEVARKHPADFPGAAVKVYREIGSTIVRVLNEYDFTKSVAFSASVEGRSESYVRTRVRFESEPVKRRDHRRRFVEALKTLPESDEAFDLAPPSEWSSLTRVRDLVNQARTGG